MLNGGELKQIYITRSITVPPPPSKKSLNSVVASGRSSCTLVPAHPEQLPQVSQRSQSRPSYAAKYSVRPLTRRPRPVTMTKAAKGRPIPTTIRGSGNCMSFTIFRLSKRFSMWTLMKASSGAMGKATVNIMITPYWITSSMASSTTSKGRSRLSSSETCSRAVDTGSIGSGTPSSCSSPVSKYLRVVHMLEATGRELLFIFFSCFIHRDQ
mmetsp:Transcript_103806/g.247132  ORF Transcript_103806/g.247132 Transcript_103806/m.247132 type:complete len:211 (+) Transcript_103806:370-1002(+)